MTRQECEQAILQKMEEIVDIYHEYHPEGTYLTLAYIDDGDRYITFNNRCWRFSDPSEGEDGADADTPIDFHKQGVAV